MARATWLRAKQIRANISGLKVSARPAPCALGPPCSTRSLVLSWVSGGNVGLLSPSLAAQQEPSLISLGYFLPALGGAAPSSMGPGSQCRCQTTLLPLPTMCHPPPRAVACLFSLLLLAGCAAGQLPGRDICLLPDPAPTELQGAALCFLSCPSTSCKGSYTQPGELTPSVPE